MKKLNKPSFEDSYLVIKDEINKHRNKWTLTAIPSIGWDDVFQIISVHIYRKWHLYNPEKPLKPWVSVIITNQLRNLIRNHYTNFSRPCLRCAAAVDTDGCKIYKEQCDNCPLYAHWKKKKQTATFIKLPLSIENHTNELHEIHDTPNYSEENEERLHAVMKKILKPIEYQVYKGLYIDNRLESEIAKELGFISDEKGRRTPRYKHLSNLDKAIKEKARLYIDEYGLE